MKSIACGLWPLTLTMATLAAPLGAQDIHDAVGRLETGFRALRFTPPMPHQVRLSNGVQVFLLEDHTLPLLSVNVVGRHGVANLADSLWGDGWKADGLMRTGGTTTLSPDSVDKLIEFYALQIFFSTGYENSTASASGLSRNADVMLSLLFDMMRNPRNDTTRLREVVTQTRDQWERRNDEPFSIMARAWNQVTMGDHPIARQLATLEEAGRYTPERMRLTQAQLFCPDRFVIGVTGDFAERDMVARLERLFRGWARCAPGNREIPPIQYAMGPRVVLIEKDLTQSSIQMGMTGGLKVENTPDYFASRIANFLLGGGGGFNSRLLQRVRSDSGFAYSVGSGWGGTTRHEGQFVASAQTRSNKTVAAASLIRTVINSMTAEPVTEADVRFARENQVNSFVFRFENPTQVVATQVQYAIDGLPANWFDVFLQGIQAVTPEQVTRVMQRYIHSDRFVMVVVGKSSAFDGSLATLGPVTTMSLAEILR